jgi:hypothetical protein
MKNVLLSCIAFVACSIVVISCNKVSVSAGTPKGIVKLIKEERNHCLTQVRLYTYKLSNVYLFINRVKCAGALDVLYSEDGNVICNPSDGSIVTIDSKCNDFYANGILLDSVWSE